MSTEASHDDGLALIIASWLALAAPTTSPDTTPDEALLLDSVCAHVPSRVPLLELVRDMGPHLTSEDGGARRRATALLAGVLERLARNDLLSTAPLGVLLGFFIERLGDTPSVLPALRAARTLLGVIAASPAMSQHVRGVAPAVAASSAIFRELNVQALEMASRYAAYDVLLHIATTPAHARALHGLPVDGSALIAGDVERSSSVLDFAAGVVSAMDGEKDPRCLLLCLALVQRLLSPTDGGAELAFGSETVPLSEELFDVCGCYYPITFTPPPNDPYGITKPQLVNALKAVFTATPRIAPHVVPLLLEKLASSLTDSKRDALCTLAACAPVYGATGLAPFLVDIASGLRNELIHTGDRTGGGGSGAELPPTAEELLWRATGGRVMSRDVGEVQGSIGLNFSGTPPRTHERSGWSLFLPLWGTLEMGDAAVAAVAADAADNAPPPAFAIPGAPTSSPLGARVVALSSLQVIATITRLLSAAAQRQVATKQGGGNLRGGEPQQWRDWCGLLAQASVTEVERAAESSAGRASARILCAMGAATHHALAATLRCAMPAIAHVFDESMTQSRHARLASIIALLAGLLHCVDPVLDHAHGDHPLSTHADAIARMLLETICLGAPAAAAVVAAGGGAAPSPISSPPSAAAVAAAASLSEARCIAVAGLADLCVRPPSSLFPAETRVKHIEALSQLALQDVDAVVRAAAVRALCTLVSVRESSAADVIAHAVPSLLAIVRSGCSPASTAASSMFQRALSVLEQLACSSNVSLQRFIMPQLLDAVLCRDAALSGSGGGVSIIGGGSVVSVGALLVFEALEHIVLTKARSSTSAAIDACVRHVPPPVAPASAVAAAAATAAAAAAIASPSFPWPPLVSSLHALLVNSIHCRTGVTCSVQGAQQLCSCCNLSGAGEVGSRPLLPMRIVTVCESIFRVCAIKASHTLQDELRAEACHLLLGGDVKLVAADGGLPPLFVAAPWFSPLHKGGDGTQHPLECSALALLMPPYLQLLSCSRRGAPPVGDESLMLDALVDAALAVRAGQLLTTGVASAGGMLSTAGAGVNQDSSLSDTIDSQCGGLLRTTLLTAQAIGALLNRSPTSDSAQALATRLGSLIAARTGVGRRIWSPSADAVVTISEQLRARGVLLAAWGARGLSLRAHASSTTFVDALLDMLTIEGQGVGDDASRAHLHFPWLRGITSPGLVALAASGLGDIPCDTTPLSALSKDAGGVVIGTYKQRLFATVLTRHQQTNSVTGAVVSAEGGGNGRGNVPLHLALCSMTTHMPAPVLLRELDTLLPSIVRALELTMPSVSASTADGPSPPSPDDTLVAALVDSVRVSALSGLRSVMAHAPVALAPHVLSLAPLLLTLTRFMPGGGRPLVRASAIDALCALATLPYHALHPVRAAVIKGLAPALDDPRRAVRRRAGATRNVWSTLGA